MFWRSSGLAVGSATRMRARPRAAGWPVRAQTRMRVASVVSSRQRDFSCADKAGLTRSTWVRVVLVHTSGAAVLANSPPVPKVTAPKGRSWNPCSIAARRRRELSGIGASSPRPSPPKEERENDRSRAQAL